MEEGYTRDVAFPSGFNHRQMPSHLHLAAGLAGIDAADPSGAFTYLDIGCGNGLALVLAASVHPSAQFFGVDLNPEHIRQAREFAALGDLDNVTFIEGDLSAVGDLPEADYIVCMGLFSWLDQARRDEFVRICGKLLSANGMAVIDYAAQPGSAGADILYGAMRRLTSSATGDSLEKFAAVSSQMKYIRDAGGNFFAVYPTADGRLSDLLANDPAGELHEVLNLRDGGLWSPDVIGAFADQGLSYCGSAEILTGRDRLTLPAKALPHLGARMSAEGQLLRDMFRNTAHRTDVFSRGMPEQKFAESLRQRLCIKGAGIKDAVRRVAAVDAARVKGLEAVKAGLDDGPCRVGTLLEQSDIDEDFLADLFALDLLRPLLRPVPAPAEDDILPGTPLIAGQLLADLTSSMPRPLLSPVTGEGVSLPPGDRLALLGALGVPAATIRARFRAAGIDGPWKDLDDAGFAERLSAQAEAFRPALPGLFRLGIVKS